MGKLGKKEKNNETLQTPSNFFSVNPSMLNRCEQQLAPFLNNHSISRVKGGIPPPLFYRKIRAIHKDTHWEGGLNHPVSSGCTRWTPPQTLWYTSILICPEGKTELVVGGTPYLVTFFHWMNVPSIKFSFNEWFIERVEKSTWLVGRFSLRRFKHPPASAVGGVKSHTIGSATILPTVEPGEIRLHTRERQAVVLLNTLFLF